MQELVNHYRNQDKYIEFLEELSTAPKTHFLLNGLYGSSKALLLSTFFTDKQLPLLIILPDKESAMYFYNDLVTLCGLEFVLFFPSSFKRSVQYGIIDNENIVLKAHVIEKIHQYNKLEVKNPVPFIIVTYPEALIEKVISHNRLTKNTFKIAVGDKVPVSFISDIMVEYKFQRTDFVYEPGQYAVRGSIIDIFSYANELPYRIDFFGDEIESIRSFDIESQLSKEELQHIAILPNIQNNEIAIVKESFLSFLPKNFVVCSSDFRYVFNQVTRLYEITDFTCIHTEENAYYFSNTTKEQQLITGSQLEKDVIDFPIIELSKNSFSDAKRTITFNTVSQPVFNKNFELLAEDIHLKNSEGYKVSILSGSEKQFERLDAIFNDIDREVHYEKIHLVLHEGFIDHEMKICYYTDHQIFDRYHKYQAHSKFVKKETLTLKELTGLQPGDYVVHIDHGIGKFGGLETILVNGKKQEAIKLVYQDNDVLFVSIHSLHRISKYKGKDGMPPKIYKLGSGAWQKLKQNTKNKVKDIARELIELYARRKTQKGYAFSEDTYLQNELEASFIYEDTPDQEKATRDVKEGMEAGFPMDRLICGDVGFGKTEIGIRAAFKAVTDNKQVAVLVPTTILALQHYNTFKERLKDFPCTIDFVCRLRKQKDQNESLKKLAEGKVDIIIGTHRLISKDVKFKDLGLLIVDEEQKFGVAVKEKLKALKLNVDTLTLTATPIPRTLQFSLMGARDLSIINTPPPNRHPIQTEVQVFNHDIIREAIHYEVNRGGQVFFIHNRVQNIEEIKHLISKLCPAVKIITAHGQMEGSKLEQVMIDFIAGDYDVLISTTIIEAGLDIPNANTIFINNAHHFGLSDMHQLRGRVGRSNKKAFCYLLAPPFSTLTQEARRRLKAIEEFSDLGSGFNISMQDLDIRGAGNMLGAEQSGFITDIGFETYHRILDEAIQELKQNELSYLFTEEELEKTQKHQGSGSLTTRTYITDCQIDTDLEVHIPDSYVDSISERVHLYKQLDEIENEKALDDFEKNLIDRFGKLPDSAQELLLVVKLRWLAIQAGIEKIVLKSNKMIMYFISNPQSPYYQSEAFSLILQSVQKQPLLFRMKESKDKLTLNVDTINSINQALNVLLKLVSPVN